jgi:hypothetical protein
VYLLLWKGFKDAHLEGHSSILLQGNVVGAIQVRSSLETADRLAARERRQSLLS